MAKLRQEYFGRVIGNLSRSLRAIGRYQRSFDPDRDTQRLIRSATWHVERAMEKLEQANAEARSIEQAAATAVEVPTAERSAVE